MQYADFDYYLNGFHGTAIGTEDEFNALEVKARAYINKLTYGRAASEADTEAVKNAVCAACELYGQYGGHEGISSENNDGYSVTYTQNSNMLARRLAQSARLFLPTRLLYRGWDD